MAGGGAGDRNSMGDVPPLPEWAADARGMGGLGSFLTPGGLGGGLGAKDKAEGDARWISEFSDGLTVAIALREWEEAVGLVEEGKWRFFCFV
jgi:exocyst complex component 8